MTKDDLEKVFPRFYAILPNVGKPDVHLANDDAPVEKKFAGDLLILYGHDHGTHYQLVAQRNLKEVGLTAEELHSVAVENLSTTEKEIRLHKGDGFWFVICDGNLEASLLLHGGIWDYVQEQVSGDVVAAVPGRDLLLISDMSKAGISALKKKTCEAIEMVDKPLSMKLFLRVSEGWKEYEV